MLCLLLPAMSLQAMAASKISVSGTVTSQIEDEPLAGASVRIKGTSLGVTTDVDGKYEILAEKGQVLQFSYIGYKSKEVTIDRNVINVALDEDRTLLDDVVVVGYGTMKRSDITGSVVSVGADEIKKTIVTSVDQALQGRAAGVQVTQNSGSPGGGISVAIRGVNSLNGNEPLYVIDGVAVDGKSSDGKTSALSTVNPSDIMSIEVLKDASATAIYGSRASNGVVLITTRHGQAGKTRVTYEGYYALQQIPKRLKTMNLRQYAQLYNERVEVLGWGEREEFADPSVLGDGTDWQKEIFGNAGMWNHQVSVSGGTESTQFLVSGSYTDQKGIAVGSGFERFTARINVDTKITKWLQIGAQSSLSHTKRNNTIDDNGVIQTALRQLPEVPARNPDGSWGYQENNQLGIYYTNPLADALTRTNYNKGLQAMVNAYANVTLLPGLTARVEYGGTFDYGNWYFFQPEMTIGQFTQNSNSQRQSSNSRYTSFKQYITYMRDFGKHGINIMAGHESQESKWENLSASRQGYLFNNVTSINVGDLKTASNGSGSGCFAIESYYGRLNYNFDNRYLFTATLRADGSSAFGPDNRWGWFPSVALAWRMKNESFLKKVDWLSDAKLRLGWGLVGNQNAGNYAYGSTMTTWATAWGSGFAPGNFANSKLKWEETHSYNIGLDLAMFNNRVEFIFDAYLKNTDNLLMQAALPAYISGVIASPWVNTGEMRNKGFEFTLNTVNISNRDLTWTSGLTFSLNRNKVLKLYTESTGIQGKIGNDVFTYTTVGNPVAQFYGYKVIGMFEKESDFYKKDANGDFILDASGNRQFVAIPENKEIKYGTGVWYGDYIYEDLNEDGVIDEKDRTYIGNPEPKFSFGFNNTITWKGFDFNLFLTGSVGNDGYNYLLQEQSDPANRWSTLASVCDFTKVGLIDPDGERTLDNMYVTNPGASTYRIDQAASNQNSRTSNVYVEDASYLRIKNLSLGYTLPASFTRKFSVESLRVYCNIQNLYTFTKYKGYDPEIGAYNQQVLLRGIDYARYPSQRMFTFGLNLSL
ncbi:SusC/RagA family TonB-linked outer membrane protein [Muribaculum intestinale]|uniref:SusC/RagA family TonB-linked outer membrane protein n=2 Tax=Muribaculum intestinale TaxID=1796646 RepID=UPI0025A58C3B|nr:TonB-dependent receptor [Muribaculum intestinale]